MDGSSLNVVGRDRELDRIGRFLDVVPERFSALLIQGESGIGKSTLWDTALRDAEARGIRVLSTRPTAAETELSFAGLIDLLDRVTDKELTDLPEPQRRALEAALLRVGSNEPVRSGAVSIGLVSAVRALASAQPVMIAVDDLQWLDRPSMRVLEFALRRFRSEPIGVILSGPDLPSIGDLLDRAAGRDRIQRLEVGPLTLSSLYQVIHARLGIALARPSLLQVAEASGYNPFFALEIARLLSDDSGVEHGRPLPVPERLHDLVGNRLQRLQSGTRGVLLAAAALSAPTVDDVLAAVDPDRTPDGRAALELAEREGIIHLLHGAIRFDHPLLAAAVYDGAGPTERRRVHGRLATTVTDPEERARHLALSASGPDEQVARVLDEAADRARRRGASDVATRFAEHALSLTNPGDRSTVFRRSLEAGELAASAGEYVHSRALFDRALEQAEPGPGRAVAALRLACVTDLLPRQIDLCDQALGDAGADPALTSRIHRTRGAIAYYMGDVPAAERHAALSVELAERAGDPAALAMALAELGHWTFCGGGGVQRPIFERGIALDPSAGAEFPRAHLATILLDSGDFAEARVLLDTLAAETMRDGDLASAAVHRFHLAELELWTGDWHAAIEQADESLLLRQHAEQPSAPLYVKAMAHACLGQVEDARREAEEGLEDAERTEDVVYVMQNLYVLGFVELSLGDHGASHEHLGRAVDLLRPRWNREFGDCHVVPDEIECLVALGRLDRAEDLVAWMDEVGRRTDRPWTIATGERSRALLLAARGDLDGATGALERAIAAHERLAMPFELARTLLVQGDVERRRKRRASARSTLETALASFEELGALLWARKAGESITRLGVRTEAQAALTPVELRIALLAVEGRTNREIAGLLFVSPKTVEANLSRVYRKLGIRSRASLASALPADSAPTGDAAAAAGGPRVPA